MRPECAEALELEMEAPTDVAGPLSESVNAQGSASSCVEDLCVDSLLGLRARRSPDSIALLGPGRVPLTYGGLADQTESIVARLRDAGLGRNDRVAIVLPNGPEMAVAFLSVCACAISAPLNPDYKLAEFEFFLSDLDARAVLIDSAMDSPAREVARAQGLSVFEVSSPPGSAAGAIALSGSRTSGAETSDPASPEDVALVLHTSGTTSRPKLVPLTHRNICRSALSIKTTLRLHPSDRCLNVMPLFHIHGLVGALLSSLLAEASVVCTPGFYAPKFFRWLDECDPTWYTAVPTMHQAILARAAAHSEQLRRSRLRFIRSSSSALPAAVMEELERIFKVPVIEAYGMTEASHQMTSNPLPPSERKPGSVGIPSGTEVAIMGDSGDFLRAGEAGEILIRGAGVTRGYEGDASVNRLSFTGGWFRTGDQGYIDADGYLFITGRIKEIINRGGEKISPKEVDDVIMKHPGVAQAVTFGVPDSKLGEEIAAAVVLRQDAVVTGREIRAFVARELSDFKVPRRVIIVPELPKGPTGKLQRVGLAEKLGLTAITMPNSPIAYTDPITEIEKVCAGIWADVLGLDRVGIHDDFFQIGGDSVLAALIASRVREALSAVISILQFFETPTIRAMSKHLEAMANEPNWMPFRHIPREGVLPISYAQQRLWLLNQLEPSSSAYNSWRALRLTGALKLEALRQAFQTIIRRHESLRTRFVEVGGIPGAVTGSESKADTMVIDLSRCPGAGRGMLIGQLVNEHGREPFDLGSGLLLRTAVVRLSAHDHVLAVTVHHIVSDGWSMGLLFQELAALYGAYGSGAQSPLVELPIQYVDYANWQREWLEGETLARQLSYWKRQLQDLAPPVQMPALRRCVRSHRAGRQEMIYPRETLDRIKALGQKEGVTPFMILLAGLKVLLNFYTGRDDVVVGSPIAGRNRVETEKLIGFFVNTLVLRTSLSGHPTFLQLLGRVRKTALDAYAHQDVPFEKLVEELQPEREMGRMPLIEVVFQFRNLPIGPAGLSGLSMAEIGIDPEVAKFDMTIDVADRAEGLSCSCEYNKDLFGASDINRFLNHFMSSLRSLIDNPDRPISIATLLTEVERHQVFNEWNENPVEYPRHSMIEVIEARVRQSPDAVALGNDTGRLSYQTMNARANQLASYLERLGARPEARVAVLLERSVEMVVGLLAILKTGAAYVTIDPAYPAERIALMLDDEEISVVLTQRSLSERLGVNKAEPVYLDTVWELLRDATEEDFPRRVALENSAYVIFTSGSTGVPKAVQITHRGLTNLIAWHQEAFSVGPADRATQLAGLAFDATVWELWPYLTAGASVRFPDDETRASPGQLRDWLISNEITISFIPTPLAEVIVALDWPRDVSLRVMLTGGDRLHSAPSSLPFALVNNYGPTEDTVVTTSGIVACTEEDYAAPAIGRPISNTRVYLVDGRFRIVPVGVPGEIWVGGEGLARAYLNDSSLTAEKFVPDPYGEQPGNRVFRTGDLARYRADGSIDFLGRLDHQVKVRGLRIELGEIEALLTRHPAVCEAVVVVRDSSDLPENVQDAPRLHTPAGMPRTPDRHLIAYVVPDRRSDISDDELRSYLNERVPHYMVPTDFLMLDKLPLTQNAKVDRRALPAPVRMRPALEETAPCRTPVEEKLSQIWSEVLKVDRIGIHENFFRLGGHSLVGTQVLSRVRDVFKVRLPLESLFRRPTIAEMALTITQHQADAVGREDLAHLMADLSELSEQEAEQLLTRADEHQVSRGRADG